jgi:nitrogen fixation protein FixH
MAAATIRRFTGRKLAAIIVGFFAVVIAVNVMMATLASRTFSGAIVKNGYVASQDFNDWLEAGRRQAALGWTVNVRTVGDLIVVSAVDHDGKPLAGLSVTVTLSRPLAAENGAVLTLRQHASGGYAAALSLAPGQWDALIQLNDGSHSYRLDERISIG